MCTDGVGFAEPRDLSSSSYRVNTGFYLHPLKSPSCGCFASRARFPGPPGKPVHPSLPGTTHPPPSPPPSGTFSFCWFRYRVSRRRRSGPLCRRSSHQLAFALPFSAGDHRISSQSTDGGWRSRWGREREREKGGLNFIRPYTVLHRYTPLSLSIRKLTDHDWNPNLGYYETAPKRTQLCAIRLGGELRRGPPSTCV